MNNFLTAIVILALFSIPFYFLLRYYLKRKKRLLLLNTPLPSELEKIVVQNVHPYKRLSDMMKRELQGLVNIFLYEKDFEGCGGLEITDEIKVTIATEAETDT